MYLYDHVEFIFSLGQNICGKATLSNVRSLCFKAYQNVVIGLLIFSKFAVDGNYTDWSAWSVCTVSCGGGTQDRTRSCTNPVQQYGGNDCSQIGSDYEQEACNTQVCISKYSACILLYQHLPTKRSF